MTNHFRLHLIDLDNLEPRGKDFYENLFQDFCKVERVNEESECGRGADLSTVLIEIVNNLPDIGQIISGLVISKGLLSDFYLFRGVLQDLKKILNKRSISIIMPKESIVYPAIISLIKKYHKWSDPIQEIRLTDNTDYIQFVDQFDEEGMRDNIPDNDLEIQDDRVHIFAFEVKTKKSYFTSLVIMNNHAELLSILKLK